MTVQAKLTAGLCRVKISAKKQKTESGRITFE